jgi:hypothetical protein
LVHHRIHVVLGVEIGPQLDAHRVGLVLLFALDLFAVLDRDGLDSGHDHLSLPGYACRTACGAPTPALRTPYVTCPHYTERLF